MSETGPTGHAGVDAALRALTALDRLPPAEHVSLLEAAHAALQSALAGDEAVR